MLPIILLLIMGFVFAPTVFGVSNNSKIYMLGDSRFVGMQQFDSDDSSLHIYHAKVSEGYSYLTKTWNQIKDLPQKDDYIIINFGVNDLGNINKYIEFINNMTEETDAKIIFMTVNPVDEIKEASHGYTIKNSEVNDFNIKFVENCNDNIYIIDTNSYLNKEGFSTQDGIHFSKSTYEDILNYLNLYIQNFEE